MNKIKSVTTIHLLFHIYPLDRCVESYNTPNDLCNKVCVLNKNGTVFKMITGITESKILTKHVSYKCKYEFDGRKCN